jgi:Na+-driven multidrug efflux pump
MTVVSVEHALAGKIPAGGEVTVTALDTRPFLGFEVNGATQTVSGTSVTLTADQVADFTASLGTTIGMRLPLAYGLVAIAKNAGAEPLTQQRMVFVSLLISWMMGMIITAILYKLGIWRKKQVEPLEREMKAATE